MDKIVECVPNFSEGKDMAIIKAISGAVESVEGVKLLDVDPGADFNRTVFTFVGSPDEILEAAFQAARIGTGLIDMTKQKGEHARMGALDVCPFIPIKGVTMEDCTELARRFARRYWEDLGIPIFLYANSAKRSDRIKLPDIRKGEYEALEKKFKDPDFAPDFGDPVFIPKSGTSATGSRQILIAYNINLNTNDKSIASKIAGQIRTSGVLKKDENGEKIIGPDGKAERIPGIFKGVQAGGMMYNDDIAQISMNILDYGETSMYEVYDKCSELARNLGVETTGSEIVGLVPLEALLSSGRFYAEKQGKDIEEESDLVQLAIDEMGLSQLYEFVPEEKVIDHLVSEDALLGKMPMNSFIDELASSSPAPGGGSVAALAGTLGASLIEMVCNLTAGKERYREAWEEMGMVSRKVSKNRKRLLQLVDEDTNAFNDVIAAFGMSKETAEEKAIRSAAIQKGYKKAIATPMETARQCLEVLELSVPVSEKGNPNSISDVGVGADMASTGMDGAIMNVRINLGSIKDPDYIEEKKGQLEEMIKKRSELLETIRNNVGSKL
ncbi:MAG: glutamate formimidoyltransferase [Candidatus Thermoplasmatota archaeon]|nr:glutamate formimidoyltransferase [Candidatus Thermoplasmatota archaeon]